MPNTIETNNTVKSEVIDTSNTIGNKNNKPQKRTLWAIIIGVNQYQDKEIPNLNYCANDAVGLANALEKIATQKLPVWGTIFNEVKIIVHAHISNKYSRKEILAPEHNQILASLGLLSKAQPNDTVLFYFSGHGHYEETIKDTILCLETTSKNNPGGTGLLFTTVLAKISNSLARQQLIWLDACHSGGVANQLLNGILQVTKKSSNLNLYCITACERNQQSFETPSLQHGIFTYLLLQALEKGKSTTLVKTDALYEFIVGEIEQSILDINQLHEQIYKEAKKYRQFKPQRIVVGNGEFILGTYPNPITDNRSRGALVLDGFLPDPDIVNISKSLARQGGFAYQPYPNQSESLQDSIAALLTSNVTETALLYLKGKFVTENEGAWLVCSDGARIDVNWLAQQLQDSPIEQQIIILDCYPTSNVEHYTKLLVQREKSQCIVAISVADRWLSRQFSEIIANNRQNGLTATNFISQLQTIIAESNICTSQQKNIYRSAHGILNLTLDEQQHLTDILIDRNFCPYKSLAAFTIADREFYYGRENLRNEIIQQLATKDFLLIVGASGSGKSSLVQAGVIPQWLEEDANSRKVWWIMRPGKHPLHQLAKALSQQTLFSELESYYQGVAENKLAPDFVESVLHLGVESFVTWLRQQSYNQGLLVIDQFEEIFTTSSDFERELFFGLILGAVKAMAGSLKVLPTLRSDFITPWLEIPKLEEKFSQKFEEYSVFIPSELTKAEYRDIITLPATRVGLAVEPELANVLIEEVEAEPGALPLLEFTLEQLWQNREGGKLSLAVYQQKIGGIKKVLQEKADAVYKQLTESEQQCAQWLFTQLISLGEGKEDTKLRKNLNELIVKRYREDLIKSTLNKLIDSRLIVTKSEISSSLPQLTKGVSLNHEVNSADDNPTEASLTKEYLEGSDSSEVTVEIAHEILIRNWLTLRWWLDSNREHIRQRNRIEERAKQPEDLLKGTALAQVEEFYIKYNDELTPLAQNFIGKSIKERELEIEAREEQIKEREEKDRLIKRGQRKAIINLTGGILVALVFSGAAFWQSYRATLNKIEALSSSLEILSMSKSDVNLNELVAGLRAALKIKNNWLGISNVNEQNITKNLSHVFDGVKEINRLEGHQDGVSNVVFSPDGKTIASASRDKTVKLWNLQGELLHTSPAHQGGVGNIIFSPDGKTIASVGFLSSTVQLWNLQENLLRTFQHHQDGVRNFVSLRDVEFSSDGKTIASVGFQDGTVKLWNLQGNLLRTFQHHQDGVRNFVSLRDVEFSSDGKTIASIDRHGSTVKVWNLQGDLLHTFPAHQDGVDDIKFSPDGKTIASSNRRGDGTVKLWNLQGNLLHTLPAHQGGVRGITFSPDGKTIASFGFQDGTVKLWNLQGNLLHTLPAHQGGVDDIKFSPDGKTIASVSRHGNGTVKLWNLQGNLLHTLPAHQGGVRGITFSPDGKTIASFGFQDGTVKLWNLQGNLLHTFPGHQDAVEEIKFSPDGKTIASVSRYGNGTVKLWNLQGDLPHTFQHHQSLYETYRSQVSYVKFNLDGKTIASIDDNGTVKLWNSQNIITRSCDWVKDYLSNNPNVNPEDRKMCDKYYSESDK